LLLTWRRSTTRRARVKCGRGCGNHLSLCEIGHKYEFFQPMMARVAQSKLRPAGDVKPKLCSLSLKEGETIDRGLAMALASNLTAEAGVDEWIGRQRCLGELNRTEAWFR